jgi:hypothetical protein
MAEKILRIIMGIPHMFEKNVHRVGRMRVKVSDGKDWS